MLGAAGSIDTVATPTDPPAATPRLCTSPPAAVPPAAILDASASFLRVFRLRSMTFSAAVVVRALLVS
jgi:hypothetical protein